jgi:hypothetical protein
MTEARDGRVLDLRDGAALYGLVASGIGLFNESILAERDRSSQYYQTPSSPRSRLAGNFSAAGLIARAAHAAHGHRIVRAGSRRRGAAAPAMIACSDVATAMGLGGGLGWCCSSVAGAVRPPIRQIQGLAQTMTVLASVIGPLLLAWCVTPAAMPRCSESSPR